MRDSDVTWKNRLSDTYDGYLPGMMLWGHKRSPVSPSDVIHIIYKPIEPKYVPFFRCGLGVFKGIYTCSINYVKLQLMSVCGQLFYMNYILLYNRFQLTLKSHRSIF